MSLPLQLERAVARYLTSVAPLLVTGSGTYVLDDTGAHISLTSGIQFDFPVLTGQGVCEVSGPCLVAYVPTASQFELFTLNHRCSVEVALKWPADDDVELGTRQELLAAFECAAGQLVKALYRCDLANVLMLQDPELFVLPVNGPRLQRSGFEPDARLRVFRVEFEVVATPILTEVNPLPA